MNGVKSDRKARIERDQDRTEQVEMREGIGSSERRRHGKAPTEQNSKNT